MLSLSQNAKVYVISLTQRLCDSFSRVLFTEKESRMAIAIAEGKMGRRASV